LTDVRWATPTNSVSGLGNNVFVPMQILTMPGTVALAKVTYLPG